MGTAAKTKPPDDPVLREVKDRLEKRYGERIKRIVLYGSRARGDHRPDSDYDVGVFLRDYDGAWSEIEQIAELRHALLMDKNWDISIKLFRLVGWRIDTVFMRHLRRDGIEL